jgi:hypothetical protein
MSTFSKSISLTSPSMAQIMSYMRVCVSYLASLLTPWKPMADSIVSCLMWLLSRVSFLTAPRPETASLGCLLIKEGFWRSLSSLPFFATPGSVAYISFDLFS